MLTSGMLHASVLGVAVVAYVFGLAIPFLTIVQAPSRQIVLTSGFTAPRETADEQQVWIELSEFAQPKRPQPDTRDEASQTERPVAVPPDVEVSSTAEAASESRTLRQFVQKRVDAAIADEQRRSEAERLQRLRKLAGQLGQVSSEKSIDGLADTFEKFLGTERRAERPAEKRIVGEFDFATAHLHDVRRASLDDGESRYTSVLVDAAGRQFETLMDPADGESAYRVMELIKGNPLLEKVYRSIVMSLMDKLTKQAAETSPANPESPPPP